MFLLSFFSCLDSFEYITETHTFPIDTTHCDIELAFDCFVFSFSMVTLCDRSKGVKPALCFHMK